MGKLTDTWLKRVQVANGVYGDGDRLYLRVQGASRAWLFIYTSLDKRRKELGLGGYPGVSLANARKKAQAARDLLGAGIDPIEAKRAEEAQAKASQRTLAAVCTEFIAAKEAEWSHDVATKYRGYVANHLNGAGPSASIRLVSPTSRRSCCRAGPRRQGLTCARSWSACSTSPWSRGTCHRV